MLHQSTNLPDGVHEMTLEHLEEMKEMMVCCFLQKNVVWSSFCLNRQDLLEFFDRLIRGHIDSQRRSKQKYGNHKCCSMIYVFNGRMISFLMHYQLQDYCTLKKEEKPQKLELFRELEKEGKELGKYVNMNDYPPGKALYANFGGVHPSFDISSFHKYILYILYYSRAKESGFRWIIGRVSNIKALALYKKIGARMLKQIKFQRKGKQFSLYFFDLDLHGQTFNFCLNSLDKLKSQLRENAVMHNSRL